MGKRVPCLVYSRIVGYYAPLTSWNEGKVQEFEDRVPFDVGSVYQGRQRRMTEDEYGRMYQGQWAAAESGLSIDTSLYLELGEEH